MNDSTPTHQPEASAALFAIADDLHGEFDKQTYDEKRRAEWDLPDDHEFSITITVAQERALSRAIIAYEKLATQPPAAPAQVQFCPGCDMPQCRDAGRCAAPQPLEAMAPAAPESFYVRFAKEWITASEDERQRISEWMTGWYGEPAAPVAAVGEAVGEDEPMRSRWPLDAAANMLTAYAELVRATGRYAEEHYLPEVQGVIEELRAAHGILPAASMGAK